MKTVYKYPLEMSTKQTIEMPIGATVLTAQMQDDSPVLWAEIDTSSPLVNRYFAVVGTCHQIPDCVDYISTFQGGPLVFHVYELLEPIFRN